MKHGGKIEQFEEKNDEKSTQWFGNNSNKVNINITTLNAEESKSALNTGQERYTLYVNCII